MVVNLLVRVAFLLFLAWVVWTLCQPRSVFIVRIIAGTPRAAKGVVTPAFLEAVRDMAQQHHIEEGTVRGVVRGRHISLAFSRGIPVGGRQQLRNWWALSGWPARPRRA
ncbi:MAG TPA: DUF3634 family protein [Gemmataceae bacterium]|nr:DUF3634 family protein [Gemmataceae bacterium]